jgi:hypothetical protein
MPAPGTVLARLQPFLAEEAGKVNVGMNKFGGHVLPDALGQPLF